MHRIDVVVGRQGIHDRSGLAGYELLFRSTGGTGPSPSTGDQRTAAVMRAAVSIGLDRLAAGHRMYVAVDRGALTGEIPIVLPAEQCVLSVEADVRIDDDVLAGAQDLAGRGYLLAVEYGGVSSGFDALLELAAIVKLDASLAGAAELERAARTAVDHGAELLAQRVRSRREVQMLTSAGCSLFQGFPLDRPMFLSGKSLEPASLRNLSRLSELMSGEPDFERIEQVLRVDPALAYHVMQLASLGRPGEPRVRIDSIRSALVRAGARRVANWLAVLLAKPTGRGVRCYDELVTVLMRARTCELVAASQRVADPSTAFAAGMISGLDLLLEVPLPEISVALQLSEELHAAAFGGGGDLSDLVQEVVGYQQTGAGAGAQPRDVVEAALAEAFHWAFDCADAATA